jgi:uncharacterized protein (DUF433 family)
MPRTRPLSTQSINLQVSDEVRTAIEATALASGRDFSSVASEMLTEAARMRMHPGIIFVDGPFGRHARLADADVDVATIIGRFNHLDRDRQRLYQAFPELNLEQIEVALRYEEAFPGEIVDELDAENRVFFEEFWAEHPESRPRGG